MTFALVLTSIIMFMGFAMTWRASKEDEALGDKGAMRNLSGVVYENFGTRDVVAKDTSAKLAEINTKYNEVVTSNPEGGSGDGEGSGG